MILFLLISLILGLSQVLTSFLPAATTLPFGIDPILVTAMTYFQAFIKIFPPIGVFLEAFLLYLGFRLALLVFKVILGHRAPSME